jgi:hypothetical protein
MNQSAFFAMTDGDQLWWSIIIILGKQQKKNPILLT